jgi:hypothetical protein
VASDTPPIEERLRRLVERELGAEDVTIRPASTAELSPDDERSVAITLPGKRELYARFASPPEDRAALLRRMQILVSAFSHLLEPERPERAPRPPVAQSLKGELVALANRARALDAFVIDAHSPVVWGSARGPLEPSAEDDSGEQAETIRLVDLSRFELHSIANDPPESQVRPPTLAPPVAELDQTPDAAARGLTARAVRELRQLPAFTGLRRGQALIERQSGDELGYLAHSFAGIYLLVLVFAGPFDELRAERSVHESIERIERLVLALPPHDPSPRPRANVVRLSPPKR